MYDNYNYPIGTDNPSAPWNEPKEPDVRPFNVCISQSVSKNTKVFTSNYMPEVEDGNLYYETGDTPWLEEYYSDNHLDVLQLLSLYKESLQESLKKEDLTPKERRKIQHLIDECEGWITDEIDVVRD